MKIIFLICFLPLIFSSPNHEVHINSDDDCWSYEKNNTIEKYYATLVRFSPKIAYGKESCLVHITNPLVANMQNGFGVFIAREMDCSSTLTVSCLPGSTISDKKKKDPVHLTCHHSDRQIEIGCSSISLAFQRNLQMQENKKVTYVQVVALAKGPCIDDDIFFKCPNDYPDSCIDENLRCNGRSECPSGGDERDCHPVRSAGIPIIVIILIILAFLFLVCVLSTVLICCCCRATYNRILRRFRSNKNPKGDVTITGEDANLMKGLTPVTISVEPPPRPMESASFVIDSTKPVYPRLE